MSYKIAIKGYRLGKDGKLVQTFKHLDLSTRLKRQGSKRIRVARGQHLTQSIQITREDK
jgi:hypothetical protein